MSGRPNSSSRRSFFGLGKDKSSEGKEGKDKEEKGKMGFSMARTTSRLSMSSERALNTNGSSNAPRSSQDGRSQQQHQQHPTREEWEAQQRKDMPPPQRTQPLSSAAAGRNASPQSNSNATMPPPPQQNRRGPYANELAANPPPPSRAQNEIRSAVELINLQPNKVYLTSPPTLKAMVAAGIDGNHPRNGKPGTPGNDWQEVWIELRGVILHVWNMREVQEANARGEDKHPTRINITDAFVDLIQPLPPTKHAPELGPHNFVFSINTAGANSTLYSCPDREIMSAWVTAIRLAGWESSRLMEIYTGHLLRASGIPPPPIVNNKLAGWFDVRTFANSRWNHLWVVLSIEPPFSANASSNQNDEAASVKSRSKNRFSSFFGGSSSDTSNPPIPGESSPTQASRRSSVGGNDFGVRSTQPVVSAQFYHSPPPPVTASKGSRASNVLPPAPFLTVAGLSQAFAVFPEVESEIGNSSMIKLEGHLFGEGAQNRGPTGKGIARSEGWCMLIPVEKKGEDEFVRGSQRDMLKWLVAFHDAFSLYGRPGQYSWSDADPQSLFFAHPHGEDLFLTEPRITPADLAISKPSFVRSRFRDLLLRPKDEPVPDLASPPQSFSSRQQLSQVAESPEGRGVSPQPSQEVQASTPLDAAPPIVMNEPPRRNLGFVHHPPVVQQPSPPVGERSSSRGSSFQLPPLAFGDDNQQQPSTTATSPTTASPRSATLTSPDKRTLLGNVVSQSLPCDLPQTQTSQHPQQQTSMSSDQSKASSHLRNASGDEGLGYLRSSPVDSSPQQSSRALAPLNSSAPSRQGSAGLSSLNNANPAINRLQGQTQKSGDSTSFSPSIYSQPSGIPSPASHTPTSNSDAYTAYGQSRSQSREFPDEGQQQQQQQPFPSANVQHVASSFRENESPSTVDSPVSNANLRTHSPLPVAPPLEIQPRPVEQVVESAPRASMDQQRPPVEQNSRPVSTSFAYDDSSSRARTISNRSNEPDYALAAAYMAQQPPSDHDHPTSPRSSSSQISSSRREHLGRRPSGARAAPPRRVTSEARSESMPPVSAEDDEEDDELLPPARARPDLPVSASVADLGTADAIAAMSFLDNNASPPPPAVRALPPQPPPIQTDFDNDDSAPAPDAAPNFPSSFGPGKQAQERRAKLEAAQEQRQQVLTKPGRSKKGVSGGRATKKKASNWDASSEEDEDEEEEDDDDASVDSNPVNNHQRVNSQPTSQPQSQASSRPSTIGGRPLPPQPGNQQQLHPSQNLDPRHSQYQNQQRQPSPQRQLSPNYPQQQQQQQSYPQQRQPSPNRQTSPYQQSHHQPEYSDLAPPRPSYANEDGGGRRTSSGYEFSAGGGSQGGHGGNRASSYTNWESDNQQIHQPAPRPAQTDRERARGSLWTTHLENPHGGQAEPAQENDKFVQLEPNERLTKAFNPNGLLGAGLEDRHDRSAKVQEQLARESGSSLLNVKPPPPPPQSGLLGAITAHERDKMRDGGVGAVLTERERDRRMAEERQRKIDALQREQLEAMNSQGGASPYGGYNPYGQPQMPMMGGWGMPQMPPMSAYGGYGVDPQMAAMMAAQQAYQQAMMSYSQAGSQMGGDHTHAQQHGINPATGHPYSPPPMMPPISPMPGMGQMPMGMMPNFGGGGSQFGGGWGGGSMYGMPPGGQTGSMYGGGGMGSGFQSSNSIYQQNQQQLERAQVMQGYQGGGGGGGERGGSGSGSGDGGAGGGGRPPSHASRRSPAPQGREGSPQGSKVPSRSGTPRSASRSNLRE